MKCRIKDSKKLEFKIATLGYSQASFAKYAGVSTALFNQVINDKRTCTPKTAIKIANALESSVEDIFSLSNTFSKKE